MQNHNNDKDSTQTPFDFLFPKDNNNNSSSHSAISVSENQQFNNKDKNNSPTPNSTSNNENVLGLNSRQRLQKHSSPVFSSFHSKLSQKYKKYDKVWMEIERKNVIVYEYLCHLAEVKQWIESILGGDDVGKVEQIDNWLSDGVILARVIHKVLPQATFKIHEETGLLKFKKIDNINNILSAFEMLKLPKTFWFELTDLYERKNIPKVIYSIHAFSHLLNNIGLANKIPNLVGKLQFTEEQINTTQHKIERINNMPQFSRLQNEVREATTTNNNLSDTEKYSNFNNQSNSKTLKSNPSKLTEITNLGKLKKTQALNIDLKLIEEHKLNKIIALSKKLVYRTEYLNKSLELVKNKELEICSYKLTALSRAKLLKSTYLKKTQSIKNEFFESSTPFINLKIVQSISKSKIEKEKISSLKEHFKQQENRTKITKIQALGRGVLERVQESKTKQEVKGNIHKIQKIVSLSKTFVSKKGIKTKRYELASAKVQINKLYATTKGMLWRKDFNTKKMNLLKMSQDFNKTIQKLQAASKQQIYSKKHIELISTIGSKSQCVIEVQGLVRTYLVSTKQKSIEHTISQLPSKNKLVALSKMKTIQTIYSNYITTLETKEPEITTIQQLTRAFLERKNFIGKRSTLSQTYVNEIKLMQTIIKGAVVRIQWAIAIDRLNELEGSVINLQALCRMHISMKKIKHILNENERLGAYLIPLQAVCRTFVARNAYYELAIQGHARIPVIKNYLHLIENNEKDYEEELLVEKLRMNSVKVIKQNKQKEDEISNLDTKIGLLVRNKLTLDELLKGSRFVGASKRNSSLASLKDLSGTNISTHSNINSLKGNDKQSQQRMNCYSCLFYILQTEPSYLAKLIIMNQSNNSNQNTNMGLKGKKFIESVVLTLFGFCQNSREEYLLLKLFKECITQELENVNKIEAFLRSNPSFIQLACHYNRGPKERLYLRELLHPLIKDVIENDELDLETDPIYIYKSLIKTEESKFGTKSKKEYEVKIETALNDPDTKARFINNLQKLRMITIKFIEAILKSLDSMPYGVRYIARELKHALKQKFKEEDGSTLIKIVGHLVYYRYINPAIVAPELFDVFEVLVTPTQRKNLAVIAKMLNQISMGKQFVEQNYYYLQPLNNFIENSSKKFLDYFTKVTDIPSIEEHFQIDEYYDLTNYSKPILYISQNEIITFHQFIADNIDEITNKNKGAGNEDPVRQLITELGPVVQFEDTSRLDREISLRLSPKYATFESDSLMQKTKETFLQTKKNVITILKVQSGPSLLNILTNPTTILEEQKYSKLINNISQQNPHNEEYLQAQKQQQQSFAKLKAETLQNLINLEKLNNLASKQSKPIAFKVTQNTGYQEMINYIAKDIKNKNETRKDRIKQINKLKTTIKNLETKSLYLDDQILDYTDYIQTCVHNYNKGKKQNRKLSSFFSRQYIHNKLLERNGKKPRFGEYRYSAQKLVQKGVIKNIEGYPTNKLSAITILISSNEVGVFTVTVLVMGVKIPNGTIYLRLEELLQYQYDNITFIKLFDEMVEVNVNLLVYMINKKFYI